MTERSSAAVCPRSASRQSWQKLRSWIDQHWLLADPLWLHFYRRPLLWFTLALVAGIKWNTWWPAEERSLVACVAGLLVTAWVFQSWQKPSLACLTTLGAVVVFGNLYAGLNTPPLGDDLSTIAQRQSTPLTIRCVVKSAAVWKPNPYHRPQDPKSEAWRTQWDVRCESMLEADDWKPAFAIASLMVYGRVDDVLPGDLLEVRGDFRAITPPTNPGGFDYSQHFRRQSKFVTFFAKHRLDLHVVEQTGAYRLHRLRAQLVQQVDRSLNRWVVGGQAPLAAALIFGQREQVEWEDQQQLMATGTLHLLAISGMHVEIVAGMIFLLANLFSWKHRTVLLAIVVVCGTYAFLSGGKPPVLRAVIVISAFALARTLGRQARLSNVLGLAGMVLLLIRVANVDNIGVHLSFLAVGTIGIFVINQDRGVQQRSGLRSVIEESRPTSHRWLLMSYRACAKTGTLSLWVWLLTCPLVWSSFHIIAPIAIPLNVLIAFPLMLSLIAGLLTALLGWYPPVGWLAGWLCGLGLGLIGWLVRLGESVPLGHAWLPAPPVWWTFTFYSIVVLWLLAFRCGRNRGLLALLAVWIALGIVPSAFGPRGRWGRVHHATPRFAAADTNQFWEQPSELSPYEPCELRCTFLDVGHGTSIIIEMPCGAVWLYDAGRMGAADRSYQDIAAALWHLPTARIDSLLISHADSDHFNAVPGLVKRFGIGKIVSTTSFWNSSDPMAIELKELLVNNQITRETLNAGAQGREAGVQWQVLHPHEQWAGRSDNAASMCLLLEFAGKRILLPGDLEGSGLRDLVQLPPRPCHVLMAPHHGSVTLDPSQLLLWCRPELVIISGNHRAIQPRAIEKYQTPDSRLAITFRDGAIQIRINERGDMSAWQWCGRGWREFE